MNTVLKWLLGAAGLLLLLIVIALFAVSRLVDPNDYRDEIAAAVSDETGRDLRIDGELSLELWPCCAIGIGRSELSNPPGFGEQRFASIDEARLGLQLLPLLFGQLRVDEIRLIGLDLALQRLADGRSNWEFGDSEPDSAGEQIGEDTTLISSDQRLSLSVAGILIENARIAYRDAIEKRDLLIEDLDLRTGRIEPGEPFDLEAAMRITDRRDGNRASLSLNGEASLDTETLEVGFADFRGALEAEGPAVSGGKLALELAAGQLRVTGGESPAAAGKNLQMELEASGGGLPGGGGRLQAGIAAFEHGPDGGEVQALKGRVEFAGVDFQTEAGGQYRGLGNGLAGSFTLAPVSPRKLMKALGTVPPVTADPQALTRLEGKGRWRLGEQRWDLQGLELQLDDTRISGTAAVVDFSKPRYRFAVRGDRLDLDRYLAPESEAGGGKGKGKERARKADEQLPREALRKLILDGELQLGELKVSGAKLIDLVAKLRARDGVITLDPVTAKLYDGGYAGMLRLDLRGERPVVRLVQSLDAVQMGGLLADIAEMQQLEGLLVAKLDATGSGLTEQELLRSLKGQLSLQLADGLYKGMDIWHEIRRARALIKREPPPQRTGPAQTRITELVLDGRIRDGVFRTDKLVGEIPFLRLSGRGEVDLLEKLLNYQLEARVFKKPEFPDGESLDDLTNLVIPLTITGSMDSPKIGVNLEGLLKSVAGQKLKEKLFEKLGLGGRQQEQPQPAPEQQVAPEQVPEQQPRQEEKPERPEDILKRSLEDLFGR
ncbi:MAG: AsmA family protein [Gammaproteobacteria bacterium]|nr:MAG: AsmA family protein [Gammaproteobacteria bacterium]